MPIFDEIRDDVANTNLKVIAGAPAGGSAIAQHLAAIDAVDRQRTLGVIQNFAMMEAMGQRGGMDVAEANAVGRVSAAGTADLAIQLGAVVAALQQIVKTAQTTRPETG